MEFGDLGAFGGTKTKTWAGSKELHSPTNRTKMVARLTRSTGPYLKNRIGKNGRAGFVG